MSHLEEQIYFLCFDLLSSTVEIGSREVVSVIADCRDKRALSTETDPHTYICWFSFSYKISNESIVSQLSGAIISIWQTYTDMLDWCGGGELCDELSCQLTKQIQTTRSERPVPVVPTQHTSQWSSVKHRRYASQHSQHSESSLTQ